jgi:hypothetical protein
VTRGRADPFVFGDVKEQLEVVNVHSLSSTISMFKPALID